MGDVPPAEEKMGRPHSEMLGGDAERADRPKKKRREKAKHLEFELDLSGGISRKI